MDTDSKYTNLDPTIEFLAGEFYVSVDEVIDLYRNELIKLEVGARLTDFIPLFAYRRVRELLRQRDTR